MKPLLEERDQLVFPISKRNAEELQQVHRQEHESHVREESEDSQLALAEGRVIWRKMVQEPKGDSGPTSRSG